MKYFINIGIKLTPPFVLIGLAVFSLIFWVLRCKVIVNQDHQDKFSTNTISGVHVSREIDRRPLSGRVSGSNAYADFLSRATGLISSKNGGPIFSDDRFPKSIQFLVDEGHNILTVPIIPKSNGEFLFGVQSKTRFKLIDMSQNLSEFKRVWVYLMAPKANPVLVWMESIDNAGIATVMGDIPLSFFPTEMNVVQGQEKINSFLSIVVLNEVNTVAGGVIEAPGNDRIVLRAVPYLSKLPTALGFNQIPSQGDLVKFNNGEERAITEVMIIGDSCIARLNSAIVPYLTTNENVVSIIPKNRIRPYVSKLRISNRCDEHFFLGRERYIKVLANVDQFENDEVHIAHCDEPLVYSRLSSDVISLDLRESIIRASAKSLFRVDSVNISNFTMKSDEKHLDFGKKGGYPEKSLEKKLLLDWLSTSLNETTVQRLRDFIHENRWGWERLSKEEIFSKSFNFNLYFKIKILEKNPEVNPTVYGDGDIWEIYPGSMLNLFYGKKNKAEPEMMIHALGSEMSKNYYQKFRDVKPTYVGFAKPRQFTGWLIQWHWPFFEQMLANYKEHYSNSDFSIWYRDFPKWVDPLEWKRLTSVKIENNLVKLPAIRSIGLSVYSIRLDYKVINAFAKLPIAGASPRALLLLENCGIDYPHFPQISLPLNDKSFSFPLIVYGDCEPKIKIKFEDPMHLDFGLSITNLSYRSVPARPEVIRDLILYSPEMKLIANY